MVKVLWSNHSAEDCTWETDAMMREAYPYLFNFDLYLFYSLNSRTNFFLRRRDCNALKFYFKFIMGFKDLQYQ